jgi:hypothetical protein
MVPLVESLAADDGSLASIHYARGLVPHDTACYTCHSGYGIWGTVDAKKAGVMHMLHTVTGEYAVPLAMHGPFDIDACLGCHAHAPRFRAVEAHQAPDLQQALVTREMSCTGACHPRRIRSRHSSAGSPRHDARGRHLRARRGRDGHPGRGANHRPSAIVFSFIGFPALAIALVLYGVARWRAGAFSVKRSP